MKKYLLSVCTVVVALGTMLLTSCSDADQAKEMGLTKVLSPTNLKAVSNQMEPSITVSWDAMSNAESYILEAYVEDPTFSGTPAIQVETAATSYVLTDLLGETEYNIRVKGIAEGLEESRWSEISRATAAEQILSVPYTKIEETSITLTWPVNKTIDKLQVFQGELLVQTITSGLGNGTYTVTGLTGGTNYTFVVSMTGKQRGKISQTTEIGEPTADYTVDASVITSAFGMGNLLKQVADQAADDGKTNYTVLVKIPAGQTVPFVSIKEEDSSIDNTTLPDGMSVYFYGDKDNMPTLDFGGKMLYVNGTHNVVAFQKVKLVGTGYLLNQNKACDVTNLSFELCDISGFTGNTFVRTQSTADVKITNINVKKCLISDCGNNYSIFDLRKATVQSVVIENSTIYNSATNGKCLIQRDNNLTVLRIVNTTLYNICGNAQYFIDFGGTGYGADSFIFENVLMGKSADDNTGKVIRASAAPTVSNTYCTNDWYKSFAGVELIDVEASAVFADPENGDFTVKPAYQELGAGDPRWLGE